MFLNEVTVKWKLWFGKNNLVIAWEESANIQLFLYKIIKRYMNNLIQCIWWPAENLCDHNALVTQGIFSRAENESHGLLLHYVLLTLLGWYSNPTGFTCCLHSTLYALIPSADRFCFVVFFTIFQTNVNTNLCANLHSRACQFTLKPHVLLNTNSILRKLTHCGDSSVRYSLWVLKKMFQKMFSAVTVLPNFMLTLNIRFKRTSIEHFHAGVVHVRHN